MHLIWFRRDLRLKDHQALSQACQEGLPVVAVYFETPEQWHSHQMAPIQADLIYRRLKVMQTKLATLNIPLIVRSLDDFDGIPHSLTQLCRSLEVRQVFCTRDYEVDELQRDSCVADALLKENIDFHVIDDKCVLAPGTLKTKTGGVYRVFTPFKRAWYAEVQKRSISPLASPQAVSVNTKTQELLSKITPIHFRYPRKDSLDWPVDDRAIIQRLRDFCRRRAQDYATARDFPAQDGTSLLSPYLAIGAISPKQCCARILLEHPRLFEEGAEGAEIWLSEIVWREFYQNITALFPQVSKNKSFQSWTDAVEWKHDQDKLIAWQTGQTGFPIVDAAMRQLNATGWMHNRLRMIVASFLVKDLHLDWRLGEKYFMSRLIDGDFAANNGGWQWAASVGTDAQPYFRVFNPSTQSKKFDPKGEFIRKWLKELDSVPDKALHQPELWAQKNGVQLDYPDPIVDHRSARITAIAMFEQAKNGDKKSTNSSV